MAGSGLWGPSRSGAPHATVSIAHYSQTTGVRPPPVGAPDDCATERHVPLPVPDTHVSVTFEIGRTTGQR
jgi:hypothetical protein